MLTQPFVTANIWELNSEYFFFTWSLFIFDVPKYTRQRNHLWQRIFLPSCWIVAFYVLSFWSTLTWFRAFERVFQVQMPSISTVRWNAHLNNLRTHEGTPLVLDYLEKKNRKKIISTIVMHFHINFTKSGDILMVINL